MNADTFNALYEVDAPVFAYPDARPEDDRNARRLITRTRTAAQMSASGDPMIWVDGEGSYICLTHVDVVSEFEWLAANLAAADAELDARSKPADPVPVTAWSLRFESPAPQPPRLPESLTAVAAALRTRPGEWALLGRYGTSGMARQTAYEIRHGHLPAFRGGFEAQAKTLFGEYRVYARHTGGAQ